MKKHFLTTVAVVALSILFSFSIAAQSVFAPYNSYEYNRFDESVKSPVGYVPSQILDSSRLNLSMPLNSVTDLVLLDGTIYVLDSGNSRILALNTDYKVVGEYSNFKVGDYNKEKLTELLGGEEVSFVGANGFAVSKDGKFYIADTLNNRVLKLNKECKVEAVILRPDEALNNTGAAFDPSKVAVDEKNRVYVTADSIALGLMVFNENGEFIQFFGTNEVLSKTQAFVKAFRKAFMTVTQLDLVEQTTPVTIYNMDFDSNGFLYTVSPYRDSTSKAAVSGLVRKLNYMGEDVLESSLVFGDTEEDDDSKTWFHDVDIDREGFINLLDQNRGRIFQYTDSGMLISVFGTKGDQVGCFSSPSAIETINQDIIVADKKKNCIFVYSPTDYVKTVRSAVIKMNNNDLEGSEEEWRSILTLNSNNYFAYEGLGRIYDYKGEYEKAMQYYKIAYAQDEYALSHQQYRQEKIEKNILWICISVIASIALIAFAIKAVKKYAKPVEGSAYSRMEQRYTMPFYTLLHPVDATSQFKRRNITSMAVSFGIVVLWLLIRIFDYNCTGFSFSINRNVDFNMPVQMAVTIGLFVAFVVSNWVVAVLLDGKGTARDIIAISAYSMIPYLISQFIKVILTNVLVPKEAVFFEIICIIGLIWTIAVLFVGMMTIHEFTAGKTVWALLLTLLGIVIIVFLIILLFSLAQQLVNFIKSVYKEIIFRM